MSGGRRKEEPSQLQLANGALKVSVWSKVLRSDAAWEDKVRWGLAGAHVRGASWDSGTKGQARSWPPTPASVRARPSVRGGGAGGPRLAGRTARAQLSGSGLITGWSKGEIAWVTREAERKGGGDVPAGRSRA